MRSSHAERDGKTFSWSDPPEGGHPGEAFNCRCRAEDVKEEKKDCEKIKWEAGATYKRHDDLFEPIEIAKDDVNATGKILDDLISDRKAVWIELAAAQASIRPGRGNLISIAIDIANTIYTIQRLKKKLEEIQRKTGVEKYALAKQKKKLERLKHERETHRQTAEELSRRYQACIENNKNPRK